MAHNDSDAHAMLSRSTGLPSYLGKATAELSTKVPEVVADDLKRFCSARGKTVSEVMRDLLMVRLYGYEKVKRMQEEDLQFVAGMTPESPPMTLPTGTVR